MNQIRRIGERVIFVDHTIETFGGKVKKVREGDEGIVRADGLIKYLTGIAIDAVSPTDIEVKGYDTLNISRVIFNHLDETFDIENIMEENNIRREEFIECIDEILMKIF